MRCCGTWSMVTGSRFWSPKNSVISRSLMSRIFVGSAALLLSELLLRGDVAGGGEGDPER